MGSFVDKFKGSASNIFEAAGNTPSTPSIFDENLAFQQGKLDQIRSSTAPFRSAATDTAIPALSALAFGGEIDFEPSKLFDVSLARGREGVLEGQAARSGVKSSGTFERLADLVSGLASEDIGRFESGNLSLLNTGQRAENILSGAESSIAGNIGGIFRNKGQLAQLSSQQRGQSAADLISQGGQSALSKAQTTAGGIKGLSSLLSLFAGGG